MRYDAVTDAPTIGYLTQHTYFNLAGEMSTTVLDHEPTTHASRDTPLDGAVIGAYGRVFNRYARLCLETQHYPDAPHHVHFPSVNLRRGERYPSTTLWEFGID